MPSTHLLNLTRGLIRPAYPGAGLLWFSEYVVNKHDDHSLIPLFSFLLFAIIGSAFALASFILLYAMYALLLFYMLFTFDA